jgi:hypothetical protein
MKKIFIHLALFCGLASLLLGQSLPELRMLLRQDDGQAIIAKMLKEASNEKRERLLGMIVELTKAHMTIPHVIGVNSPNENSIRFDDAAILLRDSGNEQAVLDAFKDGIQNAGIAELIDAVEVLSTCRGQEHVELIERLAKDRLAILGDTLISSEIEEERYARNDLLGSFARILMALASSANPSGMERAKKIREEFAVLYPSENGKRVLAAIDANLAKITPHQSATTRGHDTGRETLPRDAKPPATPNAPEAGQGVQSEEPTSSTPWSLIGVMIVAVIGLLWLLLKRRS